MPVATPAMTPWSLSLPEGALALVAWAYLLTNAVRVFTYLPQIATVWRCREGARAISLLTWWSWAVSNGAAMAYGLLVVRDLPFILIAAINLAGCTAVAGIATRRRQQWQRAFRASKSRACAAP